MNVTTEDLVEDSACAQAVAPAEKKGRWISPDWWIVFSAFGIGCSVGWWAATGEWP